MISINTDMSAIKAQLAHRMSSVGVFEASEKLTSGKRLNTARDDAAGLSVASKMGAELSGQKVAIKAASDATSLLLLQETAVKQLSDIVTRIHELAVQMANGVYEDSDRAFAQLEVDQLVEQSTMVSSAAKFNGVNIANGTTGVTPDLRIQAGAGVNDTFAVTIVPGATLSAMLSTGSDVTSQTNAQQTVTAMVSALSTMSKQKAIIGASINRLKATIDNLSASSLNSETALGRIVDTDFALEAQKLAKAQILNHSSNAMLSQTNNSKGVLLQLID
jgi:flagellin